MATFEDIGVYDPTNRPGRDGRCHQTAASNPKGTTHGVIHTSRCTAAATQRFTFKLSSDRGTDPRNETDLCDEHAAAFPERARFHGYCDVTQARIGEPTAEPTTAPCGCPVTLFERTSGPEGPIVLPGNPGYTTSAIWCGNGHGWVEAQPAELAVLVLAEQTGIPTHPEELAKLLAVTPGDDERAKLFGLLQHVVGKGRVNDIWYAAGAVERGLIANRGEPR